MARPADSPLIGKILDDRYEVLASIGVGGVGEVFSARLLKLDRLVAVKVLHETLVANASFVARFQREARAISRMHHPQCVAVIDFGVVQSRPYLVFEYLPGQTVFSLLRDGPLAADRAVGIALQVLDALAYFHRQNVVHRDLKSENLMLVEAGPGRDFVKVLDFGMAKFLDNEPGESQLSRRGIVAGTVTTMAPEQIQQLPPDPRIDIYATGILLYEMIVGYRPFRAKEQKVVARMHLETPPEPPREILGEAALSTELEQVILKALEKNRAHRFDSAERMAEALRRTPEGQRSPAPAAASTPEPPAEMTVLESMLASSAPEQPTRSSLSEMTGTSLSAPPNGRGRRRLLRAAVLAAGCLAVLVWLSRRSPAPVEPTPAKSVSAARALSRPAPAPAAVPWIAHRDLAVVYAGRGEPNDTYRAIKAAVDEDPAAAGRDRTLLETAVVVLAPHRVPFVLEAFRAHPDLVEVLATATATGTNRLQRHAALQALGRLQMQTRADLVAMRLLDVEQASNCAEMRTAFKKLRASKDPRVKRFEDELAARGPGDRHLRCLRSSIRASWAKARS